MPEKKAAVRSLLRRMFHANCSRIAKDAARTLDTFKETRFATRALCVRVCVSLVGNSADFFSRRSKNRRVIALAINTLSPSLITAGNNS